MLDIVIKLRVKLNQINILARYTTHNYKKIKSKFRSISIHGIKSLKFSYILSTT